MKNMLLAITILATATSFAKPATKTAAPAPAPTYHSSSSGWNYTKAAVVGFRMNHAVVDGASSKDLLKFHGGLLVYFPINENLTFRTGGLLVMRDSEAEASGVSVTIGRMFLEAPATIQFGNDFVQGYAGLDIGLKVSSSCSSSLGSCTLNDEKSFVLQPVLGADFVVTPVIKVGGFYELETEYSKNWKQSAMGINGSYAF